MRGDVDAAFARKDVAIVESVFRIGRQNHLSFEPRAVIASYEDGRFHIETSTQVPWSVRNATAKLLNVPPSHIRVTVPAVGGGFGLKFDCALEPFAALLARAAERPVRLVNSRQEEMLTCLCRENAEIRIRSAVTKTGRDRRPRSRGADGLRRLWRRADIPDDDDRAYARRQLSPRRGAADEPRHLHQYRAQWRVSRLQRRLQHLRPRAAYRRDLRGDRHGPAGVSPARRARRQGHRFDRPGLRRRRSRPDARPHGRIARRQAVEKADGGRRGSMAARRRSAHGSSSSDLRRRPSTSTRTAARRSSPRASRSARAR